MPTVAVGGGGRQIVFYSARFGHYDQWVIGADGRGLRPLTNGVKLDMQNAAWSPDAKKVLAGRYGQQWNWTRSGELPLGPCWKRSQ